MNQRELLAHAPCAAIDVSAMPEETSASHREPWQYTWPEGTTRKVLAVDAVTQGTTFLLHLPGGYGRPEEAVAARQHEHGRFERHTCHEEIFNLGGSYRFGSYYDFPDMGYLNHPPHWVHPADQSTPTGVLLLIKNSCPVDFAFDPIPPDWNGREGIGDGSGPLDCAANGVTMLPVNDVPWRNVKTPDGADAGMQAKHLWHDENGGWSTWLMQVPAGWHNPVAGRGGTGGDELFLLSGDLTHPRHGRLDAQAYYCDPLSAVVGGESSVAGCVAIRWTRGESSIVLPDVAPRPDVVRPL